MNKQRIKAALPPQSGPGSRSKIRMRPDIADIVIDCVLQRRPYVEIAKSIGVQIDTLSKFRQKNITDHVVKVVLAEAQLAEQQDLDAVVNAGQLDLKIGIEELIRRREKLYAHVERLMDENQEAFDDRLPQILQILRDQGKEMERAAKIFEQLETKQTMLIPLNEHPDAQPLLECLFLLFAEMPDAAARFKEIKSAKRLALNVE